MKSPSLKELVELTEDQINLLNINSDCSDPLINVIRISNSKFLYWSDFFYSQLNFDMPWVLDWDHLTPKISSHNKNHCYKIDC